MSRSPCWPLRGALLRPRIKRFKILGYRGSRKLRCSNLAHGLVGAGGGRAPAPRQPNRPGPLIPTLRRGNAVRALRVPPGYWTRSARSCSHAGAWEPAGLDLTALGGNPSRGGTPLPQGLRRRPAWRRAFSPPAWPRFRPAWRSPSFSRCRRRTSPRRRPSRRRRGGSSSRRS